MLWAMDAGGSSTTTTGPGGARRYGSINPASVGAGCAAGTLRRAFGEVALSLNGRWPVGWIATATLDPTDPEPELDRLRTQAAAAGLRGQLLVSNDAVPWLVAPPLRGRGVVVVCGTGSGFLASDGRTGLCRVGGCEYLGSDEGSAYALGLAGLRAAVRGADGRGPATAVGDELTARFGHAPGELARKLATEAFPKAAVAALAPIVCDAWLGGDEQAAALVSAALDELVLGARTARDQAGLTGNWSVAAGGGVLRGCPSFQAELKRRLCTDLSAADVFPVTTPVASAHSALNSCVHGEEVRLSPGLIGQAVWVLNVPPAVSPAPASVGPTTYDRQVSVGLCLAAWGGSGLSAAIDHAALVGVDVVDLPTDTTLGLLDLRRWATDGEYRAVLRELLGEVSVGCVSNSRDTQLLLGPHGPHTDPVCAGPPEMKREHALRHGMDTVRLAADLGAPQVRLMFGVPDVARWLSWWNSSVSWAENVAAWCAQVLPVLRLAAEHGVALLVEPHPKQVVYDRSSARQLLDAAKQAEGSATVQLCLDPANLAAMGHDPVDAVRGWGAELGAAHAKDLQRWRGIQDPRGTGWSRYGPGPFIRFRALGAGELPWSTIVSTLLDEDFRGVLYVEHEDALLPREQGVTSSVRLLRDLLPQSSPQGRTW